MPKYPNSALDPLKNLNFYFKSEKISQIAFQNAINHYKVIFLSQDMSKNVFSAQNVQIP